MISADMPKAAGSQADASITSASGRASVSAATGV